jgi:enediyne biosynthesis protein E8
VGFQAETALAEIDETTTMTLEAWADVIVPGEKRYDGDRAVAGAAPGPGAVAAGAIELFRTPAGGIEKELAGLAELLNQHAREYAGEHGITLDGDVPPFVALDFGDRTTLAATLLAPGHPEKDGWVLLTMFSNMAWDTGAHRSTVDQIRDGHPGLTALGFTPPDADGLWRFPDYSYGRQLARVHPDTAANGSLK